jgi:hypothetical protein
MTWLNEVIIITFGSNIQKHCNTDHLVIYSMVKWHCDVSVIVDEATNITEAQLVTCLPQSCQNLVLLGKCILVDDLKAPSSAANK